MNSFFTHTFEQVIRACDLRAAEFEFWHCFDRAPRVVASVRFDGYEQGVVAHAVAAHVVGRLFGPSYKKRGGYFYYPNQHNKKQCEDQKHGLMCFGECATSNARPTNSSCWASSCTTCSWLRGAV